MTLGDITRWLNDLFGGSPLESTSAAVGRKALEGRRSFIVFEALINLPFACLGQRNHCATQAAKEASQ